MLSGIEGYWLSVIAPGFYVQRFTLGPLPPGTSLYANITLSDVNTLFAANNPDPKFAITAFIESWTVYGPGGVESAPVSDENFDQNAIALDNCARITFALVGERVAGVAQVNIFKF